MAINFTSGDETILIGGQSALGGASSGNVGPMPRFSVSREDLSTGDGTYIGSKFNINITGTATLLTQGDITTKGDSQEKVQQLTLNFILRKFDHGILEISPYGGMPNSIKFNDARLISVDMSEQNEENSGTQYSEYSFTFEAYEDASISNNSNWGLNLQQTTYKLSSAEESWDLSPNDGQFVFKHADIHDEKKQFKTFTLTHTVNAVGIKKYNDSGSLNPLVGHAWSQAAEWVKSRLSETELANGTTDKAISKDLMGNDLELSSQFHPFYLNENSDGSIQDLKTEPYRARNKVRTISSDIAAGSYSVTDTWILSLAEIKALHEIDISIDNSVEQASVVITVNGLVTGLTEKDTDDHSDDKYVNALSEYSKFFSGSNMLLTKIGKAASEVYNDFIPAGYKSGNILPYVISHSETHNKIDGTISWNISFSDEEVLVNGAISQNVQFTFENDQNIEYEHDNIAIIGVIRNGPFFFNPRITNEKKLKISVDLVMASSARASKPDGTNAYTLPNMIWYYHAPQITAKSESWNPKTGAYNLSLEYTYV